MNEKAIHQHRKDEHLSLALKYWKTQPQSPRGLTFDNLRLLPNPLPELAVDQVDLSITCFNHRFETPFYIEAMTGGSALGDKVNRQLADIAANQHLAMAVGSQSIAIKYPELAEGFRQVRQHNPQGFILANLGAHHGLEAAQRAVEMLQADALELHVNVAQELTMRESEGDRSFYWLENINRIAERLDVPVIVKEVGFGMPQALFEKLAQTAVAGINVGGKGGTDFVWIEHQRGGIFDLHDFGLTTVESLLEARLAGNHKPLIATGGISSSQQILKAQLLGADLVSSAGFVLQTLMESGLEALEARFESWREELRRFYVLQGARNLAELRQNQLLLDLSAQNFLQQRQSKNDSLGIFKLN